MRELERREKRKKKNRRMGFNLNYEESPKRLALPPKNTLYRVVGGKRGKPLQTAYTVRSAAEH